MAIYTLGGSGGDAPFNRTFFNVTLGSVLERIGKATEQKLTLFLTDGTNLDVCQIDELTDAYVSLRGYARDGEGCELSVQLIPYVLIYRIELTPRIDDHNRVGFHWSPPTKKGATSRRSAR